ncbi:MAG: DNA repair protein RadC [Gemmatimonadota bacterium]|nr:DNA repair protein RadC [Gemmatimonadota bacterium]
MSPRIQELPLSERPRERLLRLRADALSTPELLGVVIGGGAVGRSAVEVAADLFGAHGGSLRTLAVAEPRGLEQTPGVGPARAAAVAAAMALGRRLAAEPAREASRITGPRDVFGRLGPLLRDRKQEEFWVLHLDTQNRILIERCLTIGLLNSSLVHPREVFAPAITAGAASLLLAHNHPSGDPEPSPEDIAVTRQLVESGRLLGIPVRDHIVIGDGSFVSLNERGLCG